MTARSRRGQGLAHRGKLVIRVTVTVHGRPSAVLLAVDDLAALEATIAVLSDSDGRRQRAESDAELERGEGESEKQLGDAMRRRRSAG